MLWPITWLLAKVLWTFQLCIVAHTIATLAGANPKNPLVRLARALSEPILRIVRPLAKKIPGELDWSPVLAVIGLELLKRFIH